MPELEPLAMGRETLWQRFYAAVLRGRRSWYRSRAERLPRPVISIGNLHWGGGGKTPMVAAVARHLRDRGLTVTILTRGYGGKDKGVRIVSTGEGPLLEPSRVGDEPVLLADQLPGVSVVVSGDRGQGGRHALESLPTPPSLFLLDDGFSHVRLQRDIDILVFPRADPIAGGRLAPAGRLREPLSAAALADAAVLTGASPGDVEPLANALQRHGFQGDVFVSATVALPARLESGEVLESPASVLAVSGIARPQSFERLATSQGFEVVATLALGDHHDYPEGTLVELRRLWSEHSAAAMLTTSKDMVKLRGRLDLPVAELPIEAQPEKAFFRWLDSRVETLGSKS